MVCGASSVFTSYRKIGSPNPKQRVVTRLHQKEAKQLAGSEFGAVERQKVSMNSGFSVAYANRSFQLKCAKFTPTKAKYIEHYKSKGQSLVHYF